MEAQQDEYGDEYAETTKHELYDFFLDKNVGDPCKHNRDDQDRDQYD
jgi:hypothetical protein